MELSLAGNYVRADLFIFLPRNLERAEQAARRVLRLWYEQSRHLGHCEFVGDLALLVPVAVFSAVSGLGTAEQALLQDIARAIVGVGSTRSHVEGWRDLGSLLRDLLGIGSHQWWRARRSVNDAN